MPTIPTGKLERELRAMYLRWVQTLSYEDSDLATRVRTFQAASEALIAREGGRVAMLGALGDFPAPKLLELSPYAGKVYDQFQLAAVQAGIVAGLNSKDVARQMFKANMDKSYRRLERLARTETTNAYWKNAFDSVRDLPELVMLWGAEESARTCPWCRERDGLVIDGYDVRDHPSGRCTPIPTLRSRVEYRGSVRRDGQIFWDKDWNKKVATPVGVAPDLELPMVRGLQRGPLDASVYADQLSDNFYIDNRAELLRKTESRIESLRKNFSVSAEEFAAGVARNAQAIVDKATPTIMVNKGSLSSILDDGFKNTYDTGKGIGAKGGLQDYNRYKLDRTEVELITWGPDVHPIYGFMNTGTVSRDLDLYGDVQVVLKDSIKERATVSFGDSLNQANNLIPGPATAVDHHVVKQQYLGDAYKGENALDFTDSYIEFQAAAVGPDDIASVIFSTEPSAAIQKKLAAKGIPWKLDDRKDNPWR